MDFGMIRSLAQAPPSSDAWEALCAKLDGLSQPHEIEQVLGYLDGALRRWPSALRVVPKAWKRELFRDGKEVMRVAEAAEMQQPTGDALEKLAERGAPALKHLRRLSVVSYSGDMKWIGALLYCEGLAGLSSLELMGLREQPYRYAPHPDAGSSWGMLGRVIQSHGSLEQLEIRNAKIILDDHYDAFLGEPLGLKSLTIERSRLGSRHVGAITQQFESGLEVLDLGGNELHDEGWVELASHELSGLRVLRLDRTKGGDEGALALALRPMPDLEELSCLRVNMSEVGVAALLNGSFERLKALEIDLRGSSDGLVDAFSAATVLERLERVKFRFSNRDVALCEAMATLDVLQGVREVHLLEIGPAGLEALLRSEALSGVTHLKLELVRMTDGVWDALVHGPHLSKLERLTIARSGNADLATPGHLAFCKGKGLDGLRHLSFEECRWEPLRHLVNKGRLGTLKELDVRRCEFGLSWLSKLFENPELARLERLTLELGRAFTPKEAHVCIHPTYKPKEWSPPYAAYKTLSRHGNIYNI